MSAFANPALQVFTTHIGSELIWAQTLLRPQTQGWEVRHRDDRDVPGVQLKRVPVEALRELAQCTAWGAFRPLKSAPHLQSGWRCEARNAGELGTAMDHLYPGSVADWFAAQSGPPPVTNYFEFTARQSGMYRITALPTGPEAAQVVAACCHPSVCLKRRLWTAPGAEPDAPGNKSVIPCLEPCALLLEFARKTVRLVQAGEGNRPATTGEVEGILTALETAAKIPNAAEREADFESPTNLRRLRWALERARR